jgi:hypothetical protein
MIGCTKLISIKCSERVKDMINPKLKHTKKAINYILI